MGAGIPALCCDAEQTSSFFLIARNAGSGEVEHSKSTRGALVVGIRGAAEPHRRLGVIRRQRAAFGVEVAHQCGGFRVAGQCGAPEPGFGLQRVALDAVTLHQGKAPAGLRAAMALLRALLIACGGGGAVLGNAHAAFEDHAVQKQGGRQTFLGCLAQMAKEFFLNTRSAGIARQHQRIAKLPLRAAAGSRFLIPAVAFLDVAKGFGAGGEDKAEHRLAVGGSSLGGPSGPLGSAEIIRLRGRLAAEQTRPLLRHRRSRVPCHAGTEWQPAPAPRRSLSQPPVRPIERRRLGWGEPQILPGSIVRRGTLLPECWHGRRARTARTQPRGSPRS